MFNMSYQNDKFIPLDVILTKYVDGSIPVIQNSEEIKKKAKSKCKKNRVCRMCKDVLLKLAECEICLNPVESGRVVACNKCGGFWCGICGKGTTHCPFCKAHPVRSPSPAVAKILKMLNLPCKNRRDGCKQMLKIDDRNYHEFNCEYNQLLCPMVNKCPYALRFIDLEDHLFLEHSLPAAKASKCKLQVHSFENIVWHSPHKHFKYDFSMIQYDHMFSYHFDIFAYQLKVSLEVTPLIFEILRERQEIETFSILYELKSSVSSMMNNVCVDSRNNVSTVFQVENRYLRFMTNEKLTLIVTISPSTDIQPVHM